MKDADDHRLESMFRFEPIPDDGFTRRIVAKVRRRLWLRRLALPVAVLIGTVAAAQPAVELLGMMAELTQLIPDAMVETPLALLPNIQAGVLAGLAIITGMVLWRTIEE